MPQAIRTSRGGILIGEAPMLRSHDFPEGRSPLPIASKLLPGEAPPVASGLSPMIATRRKAPDLRDGEGDTQGPQAFFIERRLDATMNSNFSGEFSSGEAPMLHSHDFPRGEAPSP